MKLKDDLKANIKKADVPKLSDELMYKIHHVTLLDKKAKTSLFLNPFNYLKLASMFFMVIGLSLFILSNENNQTFAFTSYDEVMMQTSSTAYALLEETISPIEEPVSIMEHLSLVRSELKTMVSYQYIFERLMVTNKPVVENKMVDDLKYQIDFKLKDETNQETSMQVAIEKQYLNFKRDTFTFQGSSEHFNIIGETSFKDDYHQVEVILSKDQLDIKIVYDDQTQTYDVEVYNLDTLVRSFSYQIIYDAFDRPQLILSYEKNDLTNTISLKRNKIRNIIEIDYEITNQTTTYEGNVIIEFKFLPSPRYEIKLTLESGETYQYQFMRPIRIQNENI